MLTKEQLDDINEALDPKEPLHDDSWYYAINNPTAHMWHHIAMILLEEVKSLRQLFVIEHANENLAPHMCRDKESGHDRQQEGQA